MRPCLFCFMPCRLPDRLSARPGPVPYLIADFWTAIAVAGGVAVLDLAAIAYIQFRFMQTPLLSTIAKVMLGGALVLAAGVLIGNS